MFIITDSKKRDGISLVFSSTGLISGEKEQQPFLEIMFELTGSGPIVQMGKCSGYKKFIGRKLYCGCQIISGNRDEINRSMPVFLCLNDKEKISALDCGIKSLVDFGYSLSAQELSVIKDCFTATWNKYTFSFVIVLIIRKIINFFRGE